jgi:hypothetical protein
MHAPILLPRARLSPDLVLIGADLSVAEVSFWRSDSHIVLVIYGARDKNLTRRSA